MDTIMVKWVLLGKIKVKSIFFYILLANLGQWNTSAADTAHGRLQTENDFNVLCLRLPLYSFMDWSFVFYNNFTET